MKIDELMSQARDTIDVKRVFGEPYEKNGTTVIPVARIMGGVGGSDAAGSTSPEVGDGHAKAAPSGAGFGVRATPAGAYVIRDGNVRWLPALDVGRIVLVGQLVAIVLLLVVRSIARPRH